jgi:hypothetical protein
MKNMHFPEISEERLVVIKTAFVVTLLMAFIMLAMS